jgi:GTP cyclohydrolase II
MLEHIAEAFFPSRYGKFIIHAFKEGEKIHIALVRCGSHRRPKAVPVRIHSRCLTGDALTSLRCDCRNQLEGALKYLEKKRCGVFIYLDQEGRGIGLDNKIKAYALQDKGLDTVEANVHLGFDEDIRNYGVAAEILEYFGIKTVALLTNNPKKIEGLAEHGIEIVKRVPLVMKPTKYNRKYLKTKKEKMKQWL